MTRAKARYHCMAKMLVPETELAITAGRVEMPEMEKETNFSRRHFARHGRRPSSALIVAAMLISFPIALLYLVNGVMGGIHNWLGTHPLHDVGSHSKPLASVRLAFCSRSL